ncbi:MAG: DUF3310 domain-containing protein [Pseudomonadota bacterium]|nr:DUF3310 domain-containing protein [Pseudomonadota bacterium]MED6318319.1 DUF3310 domain-containing protein [Pseudomonadota bacterium]
MSIEIGSVWVSKKNVSAILVVADVSDSRVETHWYGDPDNKFEWLKDDFLSKYDLQQDMVNEPPHYKDASGIECIEVTQHMRFCEGNSFKYVYRAGSKGNLLEDLKKAAWYAERSWTRSRSGNNRVHWLVQRKGEAIADSRDEQGQPFIAEVMRNIVNNRYWQAYDSLMTEIKRLESGEFN